MPKQPRHLRNMEGPAAERLLVRSGRGDREAFAELFDAVIRRVYGTALRVLRDPAMSEEVAQDVMLRCGGKRPASTPPRDLHSPGLPPSLTDGPSTAFAARRPGAGVMTPPPPPHPAPAPTPPPQHRPQPPNRPRCPPPPAPPP